MKTIVVLLFTLLVSSIGMSQTFYHINGGLVVKENLSMSISTGITYQPGKFGVRGTFYNTIGIDNNFDSYNIGVSYMPYLDNSYRVLFHLGGVYNHNKYIFDDTFGPLLGTSSWFEIQDNIFITLDSDISSYGDFRSSDIIARFLIGVVLKLQFDKEKKKRRFF